MEAQAADAFKAEMGWANLQFLLSSNCWLGYWSLWLEMKITYKDEWVVNDQRTSVLIEARVDIYLL